MKHEHYLPVVLAALTVLILGCWNPKSLQAQESKGKPSGYPSYMWLSLFALLVGVLAVWMYNEKKLKM
jgi:hypothetical protein